jgi:hypothetical protein
MDWRLTVNGGNRKAGDLRSWSVPGTFDIGWVRDILEGRDRRQFRQRQ